ncbi:hypothetical protein LOB67_08320, partial [Lactobacillus delbrueckii subsp. lactis]|nr:hypothetical protein [Lactobacillus delbrueckii subsp. lactis]
FTPPEIHARGCIAIISSLIEYLQAKLLSFQGFIVLFGVGSLSFELKLSTKSPPNQSGQATIHLDQDGNT